MEESQPISESNNNNTHEDDDHDHDDVIVDDLSSSVDTSRPFTSVREAVTIFGERLLAGDYLLYSPKPSASIVSSSDTTNTIPIQRDLRMSSPSSCTLMKSKKEEREEEEAQNSGNNNNNNDAVIETLRKLKAELEKTKAELKLLKERGSETEVALATLNAELHKNMSKLAHAEAVAAGKAAAATTTTKTVRFEINETNKKKNCDDDDIIKEGEEEEKKKKKEYINITRKNDDSSRTLAHILSLGENDHILFGGGKDNYNKLQKMKRKSMMKKHKPIIPLVGDILFFKKKPSSPSHQYNPPL